MDSVLDSLFACTSVETVYNWTQSPAYASTEAALLAATADDRRAYRARVSALRRSLHPLTDHAEYAALLERFHAEESDAAKQALGRDIVRLQGEVSDAELLRAFGSVDEMLARASVKDHMAGSGNSNRARRARPADQLFTRAAGVLRPEGARLDSDGNAAGT